MNGWMAAARRRDPPGRLWIADSTQRRNGLARRASTKELEQEKIEKTEEESRILAKSSEPSFPMTNDKSSMTNSQFRLTHLLEPLPCCSAIPGNRAFLAKSFRLCSLRFLLFNSFGCGLPCCAPASLPLCVQISFSSVPCVKSHRRPRSRLPIAAAGGKICRSMLDWSSPVKPSQTQSNQSAIRNRARPGQLRPISPISPIRPIHRSRSNPVKPSQTNPTAVTAHFAGAAAKPRAPRAPRHPAVRLDPSYPSYPSYPSHPPPRAPKAAPNARKPGLIIPPPNGSLSP